MKKPISKTYLADCMDRMKRMKPGEFDLAIVDPFYGIYQNAHRTNNRSKLAKSKDYHDRMWQGDPPSQAFFRELFRVSKNQIVWGANHFIQNLAINSPCWIVWDKLNTGHFADCELAWTSFPTAVRKFTYRWNGMIQQDMKNKEVRIHPTQKPVQLYRWLLEHYAKPGDKILDTHLGSGSSRIACYELGFDFVGIEIDPTHYQDQEERFRKITSQLKAFPK